MKGKRTKISLYKKISLRKLHNLLLLKLSYTVSLLCKKVYLWGEPLAVAVEPVNFCNLQCPECFVGNGNLTRNKQLLNVSNFGKIIDRLPKNTVYITLYFQGEPLLHPGFSELVEIACRKGLYISTSSNGHFLKDREKTKALVKSGLDYIIVSVDGTTQEVYEKYRRNGNLQQVIDGIKTIVELKKELQSETPFVEMQFLVMKHNEHQIPEIRQLARLLNVDCLKLKTMQVYKFENDREFIPENKKYSRYKKTKDGKYKLKGGLPNRCWKQWSSAVITASGDVIPCCFDKNGIYSFGNIFEKPFTEIWNGKEMNGFRQKILADRKGINICRNCSER
jgi:radical SAM protein with 4Fe4S-binding SPASM domain